MNLFSEFITKFNNKTAKVCIDHKMYGCQKATVSNFQPFCKEDRIGFLVNGHEVFVYFDEIENVHCDKNIFIINGALQKMVVKLL